MAGGKDPARKVMVVADPTRESAAALQYALSHAVVENDILILLHVDIPNAWKNPFGALFRKPSPNSAASPSTIAAAFASPDGGANSPFSALFKKQLVPAASQPLSSATASKVAEGGCIGAFGAGYLDFLGTMKHACEVAQPKIKVYTETVEMDANVKDKASIILSKTADHGIDVLVIGQRRTLSNALLKPRRGVSLRGLGLDTADYLIENSKCTCVAVQRKGQSAGYLLNTKTHRNFWLLA